MNAASRCPQARVTCRDAFPVSRAATLIANAFFLPHHLLRAPAAHLPGSRRRRPRAPGAL
jgi:hypothetical protein